MIGKTSVTIGTYNVKNMFGKDDVQKGGSRTPVKSERSLDALAENIRRADADIVALQECTSEKTLNQFLKTRGLSDSYKYVAHVPGNDKRGVNVAVISKYPFTEVVSHKDVKFPLADGSGEEAKFSRDFLRVDVDVDGVPGADLSLYTTHSKSRRPAAPGQVSADTRRLSEGRAMRDIAEKEMKEFPGRLFVLTGDFNDNTDDASVQAVLNPGGGREEWVDSLAGKPDSERNTWPANPNRSNGFAPEQFDHMIFPKSMSDRLVESHVHRYGQSDCSDTRWVSSTASDHLMITSEFNLFG
ncbi:MAG: endonuclease/exonuclease/phosphatase family protein [bacterium]|nr:endonuclease/exonuclease/phosphatase family protein [bacterium]